MNSSQSHPVGPASGEEPKKIWRVGTLDYTRAGLVLLSIWLLSGNFSLAIRDRAVPPVMQVLFKKFGASDLVTGLIFSVLASAFGLIVTPIISYKSDRLRSRWGRRIPYLIVTVPFILLSTFGLAFSPGLGAGLSHLLGRWSPGSTWSVLIVMGSFWTLFEICCVVGYAVFGALVNDIVPQEVIGRFFGLFRAVSLIAGIAFFYNVMGQAENHFTWIFIGIGAFNAASLVLMCWNVKEGEYPPVPVSSVRRGHVYAVRTYFKDGFGNSYFLWFFAATVLSNLALFPFNLYSLFYAESIGMGLDVYGKYIALTYAISFVLSYPIGILADKFHPLRISIACLVLYGLVMGCGGFLVKDTMTFALFTVLHGVVSGCLMTAGASLPQRLLPRNKFAEINSVGGIIGSLASMVLTPALGIFLDQVHHDYHYTFFAAAALTLVAVAAFFGLHARFIALGGMEGYVAPE